MAVNLEGVEWDLAGVPKAGHHPPHPPQQATSLASGQPLNRLAPLTKLPVGTSNKSNSVPGLDPKRLVLVVVVEAGAPLVEQRSLLHFARNEALMLVVVVCVDEAKPAPLALASGPLQVDSSHSRRQRGLLACSRENVGVAKPSLMAPLGEHSNSNKASSEASSEASSVARLALAKTMA